MSKAEVPLTYEAEREFSFDREMAVKTIIESLTGEEAVITSTGLISREMFNLKRYSKEQFYMTGSLGLASSIGLGIAVCLPERKTLVIEGDAALLMNLGSLTTIGHFAPRNLVHIVLDNEAYGSCSGEPSFSKSTDLESLAKVVGYKRTITVRSPEKLAESLKQSFEEKGPTFILTKIDLGGRRDLPRPLDLLEVKRQIREYLIQS